MSGVKRKPNSPGAKAGKAPKAKAGKANKAPRKALGSATSKIQSVGSVCAEGTTMAGWSGMLEKADHLMMAYNKDILPAGALVELPHKIDGPPYDPGRIVRLFALLVDDSEEIKDWDKDGVSLDAVIALINAYARGDTEAVVAMQPNALLKAVARYIVYKFLIGEGQEHYETEAEDDDAAAEASERFHEIFGQLETADGDSLEAVEIGKMDRDAFAELLERLTEPDLGPPELAPAPAPNYIA